MAPNNHEQDSIPGSQTTPSSPHSPPLHRPSFLRRLSTTVPEHTSHLLDRILSPNKVMYSLPRNDPHDQYSPSTAPTMPQSAGIPTGKQRRVSFSLGAWREKQAKIAESEVPAAEEVRRKQGTADEREVEFGVPLCREAEIEKWKFGKEVGKRKRRFSWHG